MKKVSVVMSTYNTDKAVMEQSINSILNQTYKNIEFIIVCDGNKEEYKRLKVIKDERIKLLLNDENKGLPYSLNLAIDNSTGEYIARMDSDDIAEPYRIEKQVEYLEKHKEIAICGTEARLFGTQKGLKKIYLKNKEEIKVQLLFKATLIHPTVMGRKEIFKEYKYNEKYIVAQDFELWSRISEKYEIGILPIIGLNYRMHNSQASMAKKQIQAELSREIIRNNSKKITGKYDEKICYTLYVMGLREEMTKNNYKEISKNIDYILKENKNYNNKVLKKILYNRFFEIMLSKKIFPGNYDCIKKCMTIYNLKELVRKIIYVK